MSRPLAECADTDDPELFFPLSGNAIRQIEQAKAVCFRCPVADTCLQYALDTNQQFGIWGGYTAEERLRPRARHLAPTDPDRRPVRLVETLAS